MVLLLVVCALQLVNIARHARGAPKRMATAFGPDGTPCCFASFPAFALAHTAGTLTLALLFGGSGVWLLRWPKGHEFFERFLAPPSSAAFFELHLTQAEAQRRQRTLLNTTAWGGVLMTSAQLLAVWAVMEANEEPGQVMPQAAPWPCVPCGMLFRSYGLLFAGRRWLLTIAVAFTAWLALSMACFCHHYVCRAKRGARHIADTMFEEEFAEVTPLMGTDL